MLPLEVPRPTTRRRYTTVGVLIGVLLAGACAPRPEPIRYGEDVCAHCRMVIMDERYGAELVTTKGRVFKFDSIECLAAYVLEMSDSSDIHSLWVTAFHTPGQLIRVDEAVLLRSRALNSPMGANLTAFNAAVVSGDSAVNAFGGEVLSWEDVLALVTAQPPSGTGHMPMHRPGS